MQKIFSTDNKKNLFLAGIFFAFTFSIFPITSKAAVLLPGNISTCGELAVPGTYTLTQNIVNNDGAACFNISSDNVVIEGAGFAIDTQNSLAIDTRARTSGPGSGFTDGGIAYTNLTVNNLILTTLSDGNIVLDGNSGSSGSGGAAGSVSITNSKVFKISAYGGAGSADATGGVGGNITLSSSTATQINSKGGNSQGYNYKASAGGNIIVSSNSSVSGVIVTEGGSSSGYGAGFGDGAGEGGAITISDSSVSVVISQGGASSLGANGGNISISNSTLSGNILSAGGSGAMYSRNGVGGGIVISATSLDISNKLLSATGGSLTVTYVTLNHAGTTLSPLSNLTINGVSHGAYGGGIWPNYITSSTLTECGYINTPGVYTLAQDIAGDCQVVTDGVTIDGGVNRYTLTGNISFSTTSTSTVTISNMTLAGNIVATGAYADVSVIGATVGSISADGKVSIDGSTSGNIFAGRDVTILNNSTTGDVSIVSFGGESESESESGSEAEGESSGDGIGGNIIVDNSTTGALANVDGNGAAVGQITVQNNSHTGLLTTVTGAVTVKDSSTGNVVTQYGKTVVEDSLTGFVSSGGETVITNSDVGNIGSVGGKVTTITNSSTGFIATSGGNADLNIVNSTTTNIDSGGGRVNIEGSNVNNIVAVSGYVDGGIVNVNNSTVNDINVNGRNQTYNHTFGAGGSVYLNNVNVLGAISADGASGSGSDYFGTYIGGPGGKIIITGGTLNLAGKTISAAPGSNTGTGIVGVGGILELNYTGLVTNGSTTFSALSDLIVNGESQGPFPGGIYDLTIYYYNNATGDGDWNNLNNWWTTPDFTGSHPSTLPNASSQVFVYGNVTQNTGPMATGRTITFMGTSVNSIEIRSDGVTFDQSSVNNGIVTGVQATFKGDGSDNNGVVRTDASAVWTARLTTGYWYALASSADGTKLVVGSANGSIFTSTDSGVTWTARESNRNWSDVASSADGTKLAATEQDGQIYTSTDSGVTWTARDSSRSWKSITSSADGTKLAAVVDGGQIYSSVNSGVTWTARDSNRSWSGIASSADGTKLVAVVQNGQIYTSTDSGVTWTARESNRNWYSVTSSSDGTKLAAGVVNGQIYTSTDSGVTWTARDSNRAWISITSSTDGTRLAAATQPGFIYMSTDSGITWTSTAENRSWAAIASSGDGTKLIAGVNGGQVYTFPTRLGTSVLNRLYTASVTTMRNFVTEGGRSDWTIISKGIDTIVNLTTAVYDLAKNFFKSLLGGSFISDPNSDYFSLPATSWTGLGSARSWKSVAASADGIKVVAVVEGGQIYTSTDSGVTWTARDQVRDWNDVTSSADGTKLAATVYDGQIYTSTDSGVTWVPRESNRSWQSIASSADGTRLIAAGQNTQIYISTDSGVTWVARGSNRYWFGVTSSADGTRLVSVAGGAATQDKIYTSADSGLTWTPRESDRSWYSVTSSDDGTKLAAVASGDRIYTSTDSGVNWTAREQGRGWRSIASSSDGKRLVAVVAGELIYTSTDFGITWTPQTESSSRNWYSAASSADGTRLYAGVYGGEIYAISAIVGTGLPVTPSTTIVNSPINKDIGYTIKWAPSINWGTSTTKCEYKYDAGGILTTGTYTIVNCSLNGTDLVKPSAGQHTLYTRATNITGGVTENHFDFVYDNTAPIDTDCSAPLDEGTRQYYYLKDGVVVGDCHVKVDTELRGSMSGTGTLTGNIISDSTSIQGYNITLRDITVTGSVIASGIASSSRGGNINIYNSTIGSAISNGMPGANGGAGGTIIIATSTTGNVLANGGSGNINGGAGGSIRITNSDGSFYGVSVNAQGGDSLLCGKGGNSGSVIITNSDNYVGSTVPGSVPPSCAGGSPGSSNPAQVVTRTQYAANVAAANAAANPTPVANGRGTQPSGTIDSFFTETIKPLVFKPITQFGIFDPKAPNAGATVVPNPLGSLKTQDVLNFITLPTNFLNNVSKFMLGGIAKNTKADSALDAYADSLGINTSRDQDLAKIVARPVAIRTTEANLPAGVFIIQTDTHTLPTYISYDKKSDSLVEIVRPEPGQEFTVSLVPVDSSTVTGTYAGVTIRFSKDGKYYTSKLTAPIKPGKYVVKSASARLPLVVEVVEKVHADPVIEVKKTGFIDWIKSWFK